MTPDQAEETVRRDAADFMQHNTTSDLSARRMCRGGPSRPPGPPVYPGVNQWPVRP